MALPGVFLAGQRLTAGQLNDATQKTIKSVEVGIAGVIATTSLAAELNIPQFAIGPVDLVAGALYSWDLRWTMQYTAAAQEYTINIRRDTPLTGTIVSQWVSYNQVGTNGFLFEAWDDFTSSATESGVNFYASLVRSAGSNPNTASVYGQLSGNNRSGLALRRVGYASEYQLIT